MTEYNLGKGENVIVSCLKDAIEEADKLYEENEQLRKDSTVLILSNQDYRKENEELKQFKQSVFNLIDKSLEKDKRDYEMTYEDYLNGRIEALEDLKKELSK